MSKEIVRSVRLWNNTDRHDKVYEIDLVQPDGSKNLYEVQFRYGRRGTNLQVGVKVRDVSLLKAEAVYADLLATKRGRGYEILAYQSVSSLGEARAERVEWTGETLADKSEKAAREILAQRQRERITEINRRGIKRSLSDEDILLRRVTQTTQAKPAAKPPAGKSNTTKPIGPTERKFTFDDEE